MRNGVEYMRRELMIRLVRLFDQEILEEELDKIPVRLRPKDGEASRCCIYHDRAVLKYRLMALLGFSCEKEKDELRTLREYKQEADARTEAPQGPPLTVCTAGCSGCPDNSYVVTGNCRGCFARPCMYNCPKDAITVVNQVSHIDYAKCIKCGKCMAVCPFHAIVKTTVPCEDACPVGAIRKNEHGRAEIDFEKCIFCGKCFNACPFNAIMEKSQMLDVMNVLKKKPARVIAVVAPSAYSQFPGTIEQLFTAISQLGFDDVVEAALGAEMTTEHEAEEFQEKMAEGQQLMTTSCCPAYVELVKRHYPQFLQYVSTTPSPMKFAAQMVREQDPNAIVVFIGPCIAKRHEASECDLVDYVLTFEETGAMLAGRKIDIITQEPWVLKRPAGENARNFAKSCGVTEAVLAEMSDDIHKIRPDFKLQSKFINGVDKKTLPQLKLFASGKVPVNFLEVMACNGGCVSGPCSLNIH
ncbi:MAG: monomeric [FeFe] hydrogenase [Planctomycetia bacterium]|nr:monomeric [FeFe] hydrogenase [Planctomycetia bacterium]